MTPAPPHAHLPRTLHGLVWQDGWQPVAVAFDHRIRSLTPSRRRDLRGLILPGFIDLHCHGGGGHDVNEGEAAIRAVAAFHARHGTTAFLPTTLTAPPEAILATAAAVGRAALAPESTVAAILGLHLEGPFINPTRLGAQPASTRPHDPALVASLAALVPLRVATIAPEIEGGAALQAQLLALGTRVQLGHSDADYEAAAAAFAAGASGVTHLFNAMSGFDHRRPGLVAAAFAHAPFAELILDLVHLAPGTVLAALRSMPQAYGVTDATAAAGMPDGEYQLGGRTVHRAGGSVRLADGTLAGSVLTMDQALRNLLQLGLPMQEASRRLSELPARHLGLTDRGVVAAGALADLLVVDAAGHLLSVYIQGVPVPLGAGPPRPWPGTEEDNDDGHQRTPAQP